MADMSEARLAAIDACAILVRVDDLRVTLGLTPPEPDPRVELLGERGDRLANFLERPARTKEHLGAVTDAIRAWREARQDP